MCMVRQWVQRIKTNGRHAQLYCPVCRHALACIVQQTDRTAENMPFKEDRRTQQLIKSTMEEITQGLDKYDHEVRLFGREEEKELANDWKSTMAYRDQMEL